MSDDALRTDASLIDQALAGRSEAFGQLVLKYQDRLFNAIVHTVGNAEDARDVVQEAFVRAFLKLDSFQRQSSFSTWLYRIAFNTAMSQRRRRRPMASTDQARENYHVEPIDDQGDPAHIADSAERCRQVREAIAQLAEDHRAVVVLRDMEDYDYETIAEILDLPVGTVRSRLHRARLQLKNTLREVLLLEEN